MANNRWKDTRESARKRGYDRIYEAAREECLKEAEYVCQRCGCGLTSGVAGERSAYVHHKDGYVWNNDLNNLEALCFHCHEMEHGRQKQVVGLDGWPLGVK
jgi:5-methylcytosine-specific restriction endonuclease McrA